MKRTPFANIFVVMTFLINSVASVPLVQAQDYHLPIPGVMVHLSPPLDPPVLRGIKIHSDNPLAFDFILDKGDSKLSHDQLKDESTKLIKYFLASLTIPDKDLWVNLSPYEKDRIIPQSFGLTEMGRDLLAEDYMLKQITASLIYPEDGIGRKFWKRIYDEASKRYGTTDIPVSTFNKVWILPAKAVVYENAKAGTAYVVESRLKVMLEQDYLSLQKHGGIQSLKGIVPLKSEGQSPSVNSLGTQIIREIVIPELTKEVNENKNFSHLRQVYNSLILATWYKKKIKDSILSQVYADKKKILGVNIDDPNEKERIYQQYLKAFKKGVYNYIKDDVNPQTKEIVPRKYFSGGVVLDFAMETGKTDMKTRSVLQFTSDAAMLEENPVVPGNEYLVKSKAGISIGEMLIRKIKSSTGLVRKANVASLSSKVHQILMGVQDGSSENEEGNSAANSDFLEYKQRFVDQRFKVLNENDELYNQTNIIFEDLIKELKVRGDVPSNRNYQLVLYDSNYVNAFYVVGSDHVFMSKGLLDELDQYLKMKGRPGISRDHIAAILAHELQHSVQNFDSIGQNWSEKKGDVRKKEYDADTESLFLTDAIGFNPNALVDVMDFFIYAEGNPALAERMNRILGSHPQSIDRKNRLENIIQDKNVLLLNTGKEYQHIFLPYEDNLIKRMAQIHTAKDLEGFRGDIHEIISMLAVIRNTDFIDHWGVQYGLDSNLKNLLDGQDAPRILRQYIRNKYGDRFSDIQQDLLYQIHFGFIFNRHLFGDEKIFSITQGSTINQIIDRLNSYEIKEVYLTVSNNPPIFSSDLPTQIEKDTDYGKKYFSKMRDLFFINLSLSNSLMMKSLDEHSILIGIRDLMKAMNYFYERNLTAVDGFSKYWNSALTILGDKLTGRYSIKTMIEEVKNVFKDHPVVRDSFYRKFILHLIEENKAFRSEPLLDQMDFIDSLFSGHSSLKNEVLRVFWDENKSLIDGALLPIDTRSVLIRLMESVDLTNGESDRNLFFDDSGKQVIYVGLGGLTAVEQRKSLYGEIAKKLSEVLGKNQSDSHDLEEINNLIDHNVLLDYQDFVQLYGNFLEHCNADEYLLIANKIKQFIERNGLEMVENRSGSEKTQTRAADYHDAFILAYFYKLQDIPFTFYQAVDSEHVFLPSLRGVQARPESYSQYDKIPLLLEISDTQSQKKAFLRTGRDALGEGETVSFKGAWDFKFDLVFSEVFDKSDFKPSFENLIFLRDHFINKGSLSDWMTLYYKYAHLKDDQILPIIEHLSHSEDKRAENNPIASGERKDNPLSLVSAFRSIKMSGGRSLDSVGEQRALAKGFQLWGNHHYSPSSIDEMAAVINDLDRHFPYDSRLKNMELEKIFIAYISYITGLPYSKQSMSFRYRIDGVWEDVSYEGYNLNSNLGNFMPSEEEASRLVQGFEKIYPLLTTDRKMFFGKLLYKLFRNNKKLSSFNSISTHMDLIKVLFPFYSKAKDDFILDALDEHDVSVSDYQNAIKLTTRFALQDQAADVNKTVWGLELLKEAVRHESRVERRKAVLWLMTGEDQYKPSKIQTIENENNANAKGLIDMFWLLTTSEREDFLNEIFKGNNGLFEVNYEGGVIQAKIASDNTRAKLEEAIGNRFNAARNSEILREELTSFYFDGLNGILFESPDPWLVDRVQEKSEDFQARFPFLKTGILDARHTRMEERDRILSNLRSQATEIVNGEIIPLFDELGVRFVDTHKNLLSSILSRIVWFIEDDELTEENIKDKILEALIEEVSSNVTLRLNIALHRLKGKSDKEASSEQIQLANRLMPILHNLTDKMASSVTELIKISKEFVDAYVDESVSNTYYAKEKMLAESELEEVFVSIASPNPSYSKLLRLLEKYKISPSYKSDLEEYSEFEEFIDDLIDGQLKGIFDGEVYEVLKGLIEVKFKYHSLDRRVQFLNGLLTALHGKKNKGDIIVAIAEQSGIPVLKALQILSQRKIFVKLEKDPIEGEKLNERIGSVKSDTDPIRKATIFQILGQEGLLSIVKFLGKRLGSASIKQVHKLILNKPIVIDGKAFTEAALKIKRPSALKHLDEDFYVLDHLVEYLTWRYPSLAVSAKDTLSKVKTAIKEELDFTSEIQAQRTFFANLIKRGSKFKIPLVFSTENANSDTLVILEEFVEGTLLKDAEGNQNVGRSYRILDEFLKQVFIDGIYHADLHDGNIMVKTRDKDALIDLGGNGKVPQGKKKSLYTIVESIGMGNSNKLIEALKEFGVNVDSIMDERIRSSFNTSPTNEDRFKNILIVLNDEQSQVPASLFMFFQGLSKVGKYFDNIGLIRSLALFAKYKFIVSFSRESSLDNAQIVDLVMNSGSKNFWDLNNAKVVNVIESTHDGVDPIDKFYIVNTEKVRGKFLELLMGIRKGQIKKIWFGNNIVELNKIQLTATGVYISENMKSRGISAEKVRRLAGKLRNNIGIIERIRRFGNLFDNLNVFCGQDFDVHRTLREVIRHIMNFYIEFMGNKPSLNNPSKTYLFESANHSIVMNMVNAMLRLYGLQGISHSNLDVFYFNPQKRLDEFEAYFLNQVEEANRGIDLNQNAREFILVNNFSKFQSVTEDRAMKVNKGGIDLTPANMHLQTQNAGEAIKFHLNPAMLKRLENAPGFVPVIISIQPMIDLKIFLGIS